MKTRRLLTALLAPAFLTLAVGNTFSQTNEQMVEMVKNMIGQFREFTPQDLESDDVREDEAPFDTGIRLDEEDIYSGYLEDPETLLSLVEYQNGYTIIDGKELPTNRISLNYKFTSMPAFSLLSGWYELESVKDARGNKLLFSDKEMEKYTNLGIVGDDFNYPVPGEFSQELWLNRELEYNEQLTFSGSIWLQYPSDYEMITFTSGDIGTAKSIGSATVRLLGIDRNMVTYFIEGDRRELDGLEPVILNRDGQIFISKSSMAIDADMFDEDAMAVRDLSDEEIAASVEGFDMAVTEVKQVKKVRVFGNIDKVVFMKIDGYAEMKRPLNATLQFTGY